MYPKLPVEQKSAKITPVSNTVTSHQAQHDNVQRTTISNKEDLLELKKQLACELTALLNMKNIDGISPSSLNFG